jgi:hypothetical protein
MEVCYLALLFMPLVILHHLLYVSVQLANKRGLKKNFTHEAEWTPFQTHYYSENLVAQGIEPGPLDL